MASPSNPTNIRSDVIDTTYAAYATFFDGLSSNDRLPNEIFAIAYDLLKAMKEAK